MSNWMDAPPSPEELQAVGGGAAKTYPQPGQGLSTAYPQGGDDWQPVVQGTGMAKQPKPAAAVLKDAPTAEEIAALPPRIVEEQSPAISAAERMKIMNTANSPADVLAYLKVAHPEMEARLDPESGRPLLRNPHSGPYGTYYPIVPKGFSGDKEGLQYATDHMSDAAKIALTAGGAALGGPVGAGAGASIGESGTQILGELLGVNRGANPIALATAPVVGALTEGLLGNGAAAKVTKTVPGAFQTFEDAAGSSSLLGKAAEKLASMARGGGLEKVAEVGGKIAGFAGGLKTAPFAAKGAADMTGAAAKKTAGAVARPLGNFLQMISHGADAVGQAGPLKQAASPWLTKQVGGGPGQ